MTAWDGCRVRRRWSMLLNALRCVVQLATGWIQFFSSSSCEEKVPRSQSIPMLYRSCPCRSGSSTSRNVARYGEVCSVWLGVRISHTSNIQIIFSSLPDFRQPGTVLGERYYPALAAVNQKDTVVIFVGGCVIRTNPTGWSVRRNSGSFSCVDFATFTLYGGTA